jgi:hypothetical protein
MSSQTKKKENILSVDKIENQTPQKILKNRPNIDNLLKKIIVERKQERNNNLIMLTAGIIVVGFISLVLV